MQEEIDYDKDYGSSIKGRWVPAPRFALRRRRIMELTASLPPGSILETGPGAAALLREFALRNFNCIGYDTSDEARAVADQMIGDLSNVRIVSQAEDSWRQSFDFLLSCEVLEHIDNDQQALSEWVSYLKTGGIAIIAVPCHMRKFGPLDEWAGHLRRYEKAELVKLLNNAGLEVMYFETYGFPLANTTSMLRNRILKKPESAREDKNVDIDTARSGVERSAESKLYRFQTSLIGRLIMRGAFALQYLFRKTELGDGFIVLAKKR
jgi:2-polyprenyl-3-methyl-5-hydroxy-6-metoxy-1,4-benzoquinol methylase